MLIRKYLCLATFLLPILLFGQQAKVKPEEKEYANTLKTLFPEESVVLNDSKVTIRFEKDSKGQPIAYQTIKNDFVSLRVDHTLRLAYYYDNYSSIESFTCRNHKGKRAYIVPVCGNVQIDGIFYHDQEFCGYALNFNSYGEVKTTTAVKRLDDIKYLTTHYFGEMYPILKREVQVIIPNWLEIELRDYNFESFNIKKEETTSEDGTRYITYSINNLEKLEKEPKSQGSSFIYPHILFLPKSYTVGKETRTIIRSKDDLYTWYYSLLDQEGEVTPTIIDFTKDLVVDCITEDEKIKKIYYWVQDNIRYIAFEEGIAGFKPEKAETVLNNKYGDCKGMANLLKAMFTSIGIDARLTWLGTNSVRYDYSTPALCSDNHIICTVLRDDEKIFLDATEKFSPLYGVAERIQGRQVLIEDGSDYIFDSIPKLSEELNAYKREYRLEVSESKLIGKANYEINGERKTSILSLYHAVERDDKEEVIKELLKGNTNIVFSDFLIENTDNRDSTLYVKANVEIENEISEFNNELYISLDPFKSGKIFEIEKDRKSDVYFHEKVNHWSTIMLDIPRGMEVKYLPEELHVENDHFNCSIQYKVSGNKILVDRKIKIPDGVVPVGAMDEWNQLQNELKGHSKGQVILKQK